MKAREVRDFQKAASPSSEVTENSGLDDNGCDGHLLLEHKVSPLTRETFFKRQPHVPVTFRTLSDTCVP
ncbi:MAG: hypothetical protein EOO73_05150 [Myxococcales bacterium]|nr:MAG: hypothetical protein EOO73_05150 [Myxococcales bacterium]